MSKPRPKRGKRSGSAKTRTIQVGALARVEGEGAMLVKIKGDKVTDVKLQIYEPPRFFEAFLRGRKFTEAPDITARICGICPIAYQMGAAHAMEDACGVRVSPAIRALRRLIYCGEWIESHVLHVSMLHAPDFLGYQDAIQMAQHHPDLVKMALRLKRIGNELMEIVGGRAVHPINPTVGGFFSAPSKERLKAFAEELKWAQDAALKTVRFTSTLDFPDFEQDYEYVALSHPDEYAITEGRLVSNKGIDIALRQFDDTFVEEHVAHSTSLHATVKGRGAYHTGPLARYTLNYDRLSPLCKEAAKKAGLGKTCYNPFKSIVVRSVETLYAVEEALRIIRAYERPDPPRIVVQPRAGTGYGCTEAPRGICFHRYTIDDSGVIRDAKIVPPTSQNQKAIESDLLAFVSERLHLPHDQLQWQCEQAIRNYDPCISCSCHYLKLKIERE